MKPLFEYINEAVEAKSGISMFEWAGNMPHVVIDNLVQRLPGYGFKSTNAHVTNCEYKVSHNGACLTIGVRPRATGEGNRAPSAKIFVRQCTHGKLSVVEKYLNIEGDGKATFKVLSVADGKFIWTETKSDELPTCGDIDDSVEFAELLIDKIMKRCKRYTK